MQRRRFLGLGVAAAGLAAGQQKRTADSVTATATQDTTPRVGIVLSSFRGSSDHDGTVIRGLADPRPVDADLTAAQIDAMLRKAIELGNTRQGGLGSIVGPEDWVVIKPAKGTDPRLVRGLIQYLVEHKGGQRITIAQGTATWVREFWSRYPAVKFETVELSAAESIEMPAPGGAVARRNREGMYRVPKIVQQCDKLISLSPLQIDPETGVALAMRNYLDIVPSEALRQLGTPDEVLVDLFSFHPADYAIVGGSQGTEGDGSTVHHNLILAGASALAVDAVGAAVMGYRIQDLAFLRMAWRKGFGTCDIDSIWTRGNEIQEARRVFRKPSKWVPNDQT